MQYLLLPGSRHCFLLVACLVSSKPADLSSKASSKLADLSSNELVTSITCVPGSYKYVCYVLYVMYVVYVVYVMYVVYAACVSCTSCMSCRPCMACMLCMSGMSCMSYTPCIYRCIDTQTYAYRRI